MSRATLTLLILPALSGPAWGAEVAAEPGPGARVRVTARDGAGSAKALEGTLANFDGRQLTLTVAGRHEAVTVAAAAVRKVEVSRGKKGNAMKGMLLGAATLGAGLAIAGAVAEGCPPSRPLPLPDGTIAILPCVEAGGAIESGLLGVLGGAGWGALIGHFVRTEKWSEVPLDRLQLTVTPMRGGGRLAVSVRF